MKKYGGCRVRNSYCGRATHRSKIASPVLLLLKFTIRTDEYRQPSCKAGRPCKSYSVRKVRTFFLSCTRIFGEFLLCRWRCHSLKDAIQCTLLPRNLPPCHHVKKTQILQKEPKTARLFLLQPRAPGPLTARIPCPPSGPRAPSVRPSVPKDLTFCTSAKGAPGRPGGGEAAGGRKQPAAGSS